MEIILAIIFVLITVFAMGQRDTKIKKDKRPVKVSLLSNYYEQEGEHSAVNGGRGSQQLESVTQEMSIYVPVKDSSAVKVSGGIDYFTSASMLEIDKYQTSASSGTSNVSGDELRKFANIGLDWANKKKGTLLSPSVGFSSEYDVLSLNAGLGWSKNLKKRQGNYNVGLNFISDRWMMVYPGEFRSASSNGTTDYTTGASTYTSEGGTTYTSGATTTGSGSTSGSGGSGSGSHTTGSGNTSGNTSGGTNTGSGSGSHADETENKFYTVTPIELTGKTKEKDGKTYSLDWRYSLALSNGYSFVINKKMNASLGLDLIAQKGMLSTPFHRVYFNDGVDIESEKEVRIEKLPELRLKTAIYGRFNYTYNANIRLRTYARYYLDNWGIQAIAVTVETPVKATKWLTVTPFYRFYAQTESKYFSGYGERRYEPNSFYTSDFDLSAFTSHKTGLGLRVSPLKPIFGVKDEENANYVFSLSSLGVRYAYYARKDGLSTQSVTLELNFEF